MYMAMTKLEQRLAQLPEEQRAAALRDAWRAFRASDHFDFVVAILRDIERQALAAIRQRPGGDLRVPATALHVVDLIRRSFMALDSGRGADSTGVWNDGEDFMPEAGV